MLKYLFITSLVFLQVSCKESVDAPQDQQGKTSETTPQKPLFKAPEGTSKEESIALEVTHLMHAFSKGDSQTLVESAHPVIFEKIGGKEKYRKAINGSLKTLKKLNITIDDFVATPPKVFYKNGEEEEICFVTTKYIMTLSGKKSDVDSFMLAIGNEITGWKFIDGAGLTISPKLIHELFPLIPKDVKLPVHNLTKIEEPVTEKTTETP